MDIIALLTPALGALAIVYSLRFFSIGKAPSEQYEMGLDIPAGYPTRRSAMADAVDRTTDTVKQEVKRIRRLPPLR